MNGIAIMTRQTALFPFVFLVAYQVWSEWRGGDPVPGPYCRGLHEWAPGSGRLKDFLTFLLIGLDRMN